MVILKMLHNKGVSMKVIIETVEEMLHCGLSQDWVKEEVECMFDQEFTDKEWDSIILQAQIRRAFSRPVPQKV